MQPRKATLSFTLVLLVFLAAPLVAESQQTKFWALDSGGYWDYLESPSDTSPSRVQVTLDAGLSFPTYLMVTTKYQDGFWTPVDNWRYDIHESGPDSSKLRVWQFIFTDSTDRVTFTSDSDLTWAKRPITVGDSWTSSASAQVSGSLGSGGGAYININGEVLAYESVDVPFGNGTYNAYKISNFVEAFHPLGKYWQTKTFWFVPYLGIIKYESVYWNDITEKVYLSAMDIATVFTDAIYDHWAYPYIMQIYDAGITTGYGDGRYGPDDPVTREQMAKFILTGLNQVPPDGYCGLAKPFTDVPVDRWSCKYIKKLAELGITTGYEDGSFHPEEPISREGMATFLIRALNEVPADGYCGGEGPFTDVPFDRWSCKYVKRFAELGITTGYGDGRYGPLDPVTRAQMAVFLSRAFLEM